MKWLQTKRASLINWWLWDCGLGFCQLSYGFWSRCVLNCPSVTSIGLSWSTPVFILVNYFSLFDCLAFQFLSSALLLFWFSLFFFHSIKYLKFLPLNPVSCVWLLHHQFLSMMLHSHHHASTMQVEATTFNETSILTLFYADIGLIRSYIYILISSVPKKTKVQDHFWSWREYLNICVKSTNATIREHFLPFFFFCFWF